jgi:hypothetical protein
MTEEKQTVINFRNPGDIIYWSKKWEISPDSLFSAYLETKSDKVEPIKNYLRNIGFAL